ncbi:unnamed protein product, partial [marine sediment metagenome]
YHMRSMLSTAELRLLKGGRGLSNNYRRHLSVRISKKLSRIIALLTDPKFAPYLDRLETSLELQRLWLFRKQSFAVSGGWSSDLITYGVTQTDFSDFERANS